MINGYFRVFSVTAEDAQVRPLRFRRGGGWPLTGTSRHTCEGERVADEATTAGSPAAAPRGSAQPAPGAWRRAAGTQGWDRTSVWPPVSPPPGLRLLRLRLPARANFGTRLKFQFPITPRPEKGRGGAELPAWAHTSAPRAGPSDGCGQPAVPLRAPRGRSRALRSPWARPRPRAARARRRTRGGRYLCPSPVLSGSSARVTLPLPRSLPAALRCLCATLGRAARRGERHRARSAVRSRSAEGTARHCAVPGALSPPAPPILLKEELVPDRTRLKVAPYPHGGRLTEMLLCGHRPAAARSQRCSAGAAPAVRCGAVRSVGGCGRTAPPAPREQYEGSATEQTRIDQIISDIIIGFN